MCAGGCPVRPTVPMMSDQSMPHGPDGNAADTAAGGIAIAMRLLAFVAVLAVVGTITGLVLVQRIGTGYRDGLTVARDGADVAAQSSDSALSLATDLSSLTAAASDGLDQTETIVEVASASISDVGTAMGSNLADGVEGTASIADSMADFIEGIERLIPGDTKSLAEDLRVLSDGLEPVPDQLRSLGDQLTEASTQLDGSIQTLNDLETQLDALSVSIAQARIALAGVQASADDLAVRAQSALDRSSTDLWLLRVMVLVVGIGVAAACLAARRALRVLGAGGGTRTHTPLGTGS
ncbi:MAG: hypothetical protein JWN99_92 [Ilumatobacteraceae bacterium]|nr:hypothetical protein [Ilumatobacteraceae bacterium]